MQKLFGGPFYTMMADICQYGSRRRQTGTLLQPLRVRERSYAAVGVSRFTRVPLSVGVAVRALRCARVCAWADVSVCVRAGK